MFTIVHIGCIHDEDTSGEEYDASAEDLENGSDYLDYDSYDPTEYDDDYDKK